MISGAQWLGRKIRSCSGKLWKGYCRSSFIVDDAKTMEVKEGPLFFFAESDRKYLLSGTYVVLSDSPFSDRVEFITEKACCWVDALHGVRRS